MEKDVNWSEYFRGIREQCPWSYRSYQQGKIDIIKYQGDRIPLGDFDARIYVINAPSEIIESLAFAYDHNDLECEWLYSYPGYGPYATPCGVLIQQDRSTLENLRSKLDADNEN